MRDPIKIIHKFKNNNRRIQYTIYIFIGNLINDKIKNILSIIKNKDLYNSIISLNKKQIKILENYYGNRWYTKFFNSYHIKKQKELIKKNINKKKNIIKFLGKQWYETNIEKKITKNIEYSFATSYYKYLIDRNKIKSKTKKKELDFRTFNFNKIGGNYNIYGGDIEEDDEKKDEDDEKKDEDEVDLEELDEEIIDNFNLDEITKLYSVKDIESSKELKETSKLISEAINDKKWEKKINETELNYNDKLDNLPYDTNLENIFDKNYVYDQYIFKDDTIKIMREKVTVSLALNPKFGKINKIIPEYQYFWSEYMTNNNTDLVMIGQKWIRRNELLTIDVQPNNNLAVYEKLRNNLSYLKDNFGFKIKREDDEMNIIREYNKYISNNDIYMIDILNEIGTDYNSKAEEKKNLYDVFVNIYFPLITYDRFETIINLLNGNYDKENIYNQNVYNTINNDMKLESIVYNIVEKTKLEYKKYQTWFYDNHILQSYINVDISNDKNITGTVSKDKYNLYRIFESFLVSKKYPFLELHLISGQITYKIYYDKKIENEKTMNKWFSSEPFGLTFKIKVDLNDLKNKSEKFISVTLKESGKFEYKISWKEDEEATTYDIKKSYKYIHDLLQKINSENKKIKIIIPSDHRFEYTFMNTIRKFTLPKKLRINHNEFSNFCRFFFPYISLIIDPKKRESKNQNIKTNISSKFGTYLRYKRINKYENRTKMHLRILYFLRNFEISSKVLIDEISKQFNLTSEVAAKEIDYVRDKYGKAIKRSSKILKKLKTLPKAKPQGIDLAIQGKDLEKVKIRISGARSKEQLEEISAFMKVLIFLYVETYLLKKNKYKKIIDQLKKLNKIAKRRNKVTDVVDYDGNKNNVKDFTSGDKKRLAFKPEKGQAQYSRSCQNSGHDKKRRPERTPGSQLDKLLKSGYTFNKKTDFYEKTVNLEIKGKKYKVTLRAIKLFTDDNTSGYNFYTCDPSTNGKHTFIGFLSRGNHPDDLPLPCCFKKDQYTSNNIKKISLYKRALGLQISKEKNETLKKTKIGDKIYILQDTNKLQAGRFIALKRELNNFFNKIWGNTNTIKNHYLTESKTGYFFKYTVKDNNYYLLVALADIYDKTIDELKKLCIETLKNDKNDIIYKYLNNGDVSSRFGNKNNFINYIETSLYLEYEILGELLAIPNVLSKNGIYYFIIESRSTIKKNQFEKDKYIKNYYLSCLNQENSYQIDEDRTFIILLKENKYYHPIYKVKKDSNVDKKIILIKNYDKKNDSNIINELIKYYSNSCLSQIINNINEFSGYENKSIIELLKKNNINVKYQIIDNRNKSKYLVLNNILLPTNPTGISYKIQCINISDNINKYILNLKDTIKEIKKINKIIDLNYIPKTVYYSENKNNQLKINSLLLYNNLIIPIKNETYNKNQINNLGITYKFMSIEEQIDIEIFNNNNNTYDDRTKRYKELIFYSEGYNLYRLELSIFLNKNINLKNELINIVRNKDIIKKEKKKKIRQILFSIIDYKLSNKIKNLIKNKNFTHIVKNIGNLQNYNIKNVRDSCQIYNKKNNCNNNLHCIWNKNTCKFKLNDKMIIDYINKILVEIIRDDIKFKEIIQENDYYVSDIVNYNVFTNRPNQKVFTNSNKNIKEILSELYGKDNIPLMGKKNLDGDFMEINENDEYQTIEFGNQIVQEIISNNDSILRAFVNCYYWNNNPLYNNNSRNLGSISNLQTQMVYLLKAKIIQFILNNKNNKKFSELKDKFPDKENFFKSAINKFRKTNINTDGSIELVVLSYLFDYPIIIYNNYGKVIDIYLQGKRDIQNKKFKKIIKNKSNNSINIKLNFESSSKIPTKIFSIYYEIQ